MQSRTPQGAEPGPTRAETDSRLSAALASVVAGARRRAMRDGDRQIDTAHLLHSLLETDPDVRAAFDDGAQVVRLLGYLVQRSIGYGLQWQGTVEDSGAVPLVREHDLAAVKESGWSPAATAAMERAIERSDRRGEPRALGIDLLLALVADPDCRAVEVLGRAGADARAILRRIEDDPLAGTYGDPYGGPYADPFADPHADPRADPRADPYAGTSAD
ncbi:Clp protease N-terminal domain-containing protein [Streptomyces sp. NPDC057302]|uniref:Clp protease N-terminal domain-containing protein n=1 Tax=Streptomyces sp. NPDC057302 TaxID=3346094 RepID=UPI0036278F6E